MLPAPSLDQVVDHITSEAKPLSCLVFAPQFDTVGSKQIIPRFGYLDYRTGQNIHFYLAGYYGYGNAQTYYPDGQALGVFKYESGTQIPWYFSQLKFAEFVDQLERITKWKYQGGTELLLLNQHADFSKTIRFSIDQMLKDGALDNVNELLEALIQYSRKEDQSLQDFSLKAVGKQSGKVVVDALTKCLPKGAQHALKVWKQGKHYAWDNLLQT